jgi:hypothetical protein
MNPALWMLPRERHRSLALRLSRLTAVDLVRPDGTAREGGRLVRTLSSTGT